VKLLVDIGNSAVKWALSRAGQLVQSGRFAHRDEDFPALATAAWSSLQRPSAIVVGNVAGDAIAQDLRQWVQRHWSLQPRFLQSTHMAAGVRNGYAEPAALGIDRWAAMLAAYAQYRSAVCVVDCGTAITLDLVDADGVHRGGLILAGIELMQAGLRANTANLHVTPAEAPLQLLASRTGDAIASGSVYAAASAVGHIGELMAGQCMQQPWLVLTGGDAGRIQPLLDIETRLHPDLVLSGLDILSGDS
jgi:type III pantothenate kinase